MSAKKALIIFIAALALVNLLLGVIFSGLTYPGTTVAGTKIGMISRSELGTRIMSLDLIPNSISLENPKYQLETEGLIDIDQDKLTESERQARSFLPLLNLLKPPKLPLEVKVDESKLNIHKKVLAAKFHADPINARIDRGLSEFFVLDHIDGHDLIWDQLDDSIRENARQADFEFTPSLATLPPTVSTQSLNNELDNLNRQLSAEITLTINTQSIRVEKSEIIKWYERSGASWKTADYLIRNNIEKIAIDKGFSSTNLPDIVSKAKRTLLSAEKAAIAVKTRTPSQKTLTYCVKQKGLSSSVTNELSEKAKVVLNDSRGWGLGGHLIFKQVSTGCDFTIWLSTAADVPTFGAICDRMWSCMVSPNVVINYDRWRDASDTWNKDRQSLDDYRTMVINHEVGHFLGLGHYKCPANGAPALVMQQQSFDLGKCQFNPWPRENELELVRTLQKL